ncbi:hypothetical protein CC80DRAFT_198760 [Byssothecium circinans]|uniref:RING-type domain-containing protein n=1 Tax=Byssothecium circinans TaxID=147558 RepID=A0A6A5ULA3_9PLEO|nr:hypothetical protein CC80DRAFT_198760 [Byssothecium circinans]
MAEAPADPKAAPLADDLREFAITLDSASAPKNFSCAICNTIAIDAYKLLCCNKPICSNCQEKLTFPATCPLCEHHPLEAESCVVNKVLRNTLRIWLAKQKKKKKGEKAASEAPTPTVETPTIQPTPVVEAAPVEEAGATSATTEVEEAEAVRDAAPAVETTSGAEDVKKTSTKTEADAPPERAASSTPQAGEKSAVNDQGEESADGASKEDAQYVQGMDGQSNGMFNNNQNMFQNGMPGQFGNYGPGRNQAGFGNGMPFNGMNPMNGMPNMMGNNMYMNPMGYGMNNANSMYGGYGGGMGLGMNPMNYGGGYGNGWGGMGGNYDGYNVGHNQSGAFPGMNQFQNKTNFPNQNRFNSNGGPFPQRANRNGSFGGGFGPGNGFNNANSRPGSGNGPINHHVRRFHQYVPHQLPKRPNFPTIAPSPTTKTDQCVPLQRDGQSPAGSAEPTVENKTESEHSAEVSAKGKATTQQDANVGESQDGEDAQGVENLTKTAGIEVPESNTLNQIQSVAGDDDDSQNFDYGMQSGMGFAPNMMGQYPQQPQFMNGPYQPHYNQNSFAHRGDHNAAYGSSTVVVGEPRGLGVAGAPTGPRAMREKNNLRGPNNPRFNPQAPRATPVQSSAPGSPQRESRSSPIRDEALRTREKSPSRSRSHSRGRDETREHNRERSRSADRGEDDKERVRTPAGDDDDRHEEHRRHRFSRHDDERDDYDGRHREDRDSRGNRTRSTTPDSKHRSRREEKHRSSRSHRDRSREHRKRHRSHSRSPAAENRYEDDADKLTSRRKSKSDKDKYRDRSRDRDRDGDRRDRKERDYDDDKYRSRDKEKDRERRRRRDREADDEDRDYDDDKYHDKHRSRRSRKDRDRERDRERDYDKEPRSATSTRPVSPPVNAPAGPSADRFSFRGASSKAKVMPPPPTGPRGLHAPKGPSADREGRGRTNSVISVPATPTESSVPDHYAAERERNARERVGLDTRELFPKQSSSSKPLQSRISSSSRPSLSSKRSRDDVDAVDAAPVSSSHRDKRRKSRDGDGNGGQLASLFTKGLRKSAGKRGGVKTEGEVERELERTERERDGRRW